jgi:hypothetical protein
LRKPEHPHADTAFREHIAARVKSWVLHKRKLHYISLYQLKVLLGKARAIGQWDHRGYFFSSASRKARAHS